MSVDPATNPVTGLKPLPPSLRPIAKGGWQRVFRLGRIDSVTKVQAIIELEAIEDRRKLTADEQQVLASKREALAWAYLSSRDLLQDLIDRPGATVDRVGLHGFWYRHGIDDLTHFVYWPWRLPNHGERFAEWLTGRIRIRRIVLIICCVLPVVIVRSCGL